MSPSPRHNRQDPADFLKGGRYIVADEDAVFIGEPLKATGLTSGGAVGGPAYDKVVRVGGYTDTTSQERCIGVSDDQIPTRGGPIGSNERAVQDALYKSLNEWRQGRREPAIVVHGVRDMINKKSGYVAIDNDLVSPYPGGFVPYEPDSNMTILGRIKKGPIVYNDRGPVIIEPRHTTGTITNNEEGWNDDGYPA